MSQLNDGTVCKLEVTRYSGPGPPVTTADEVVVEMQLRLILNGTELLVASLLPHQQLEFACGILFSTGLISSRDEIRQLSLDPERGIVFVELEATAGPLPDFADPPLELASACGNQPLTFSTARLAPLDSALCVSYRDIEHCAHEVQQDSVLFRRTGGVHSVAVYSAGRDCLARADDIGRHTAFDKVVGSLLMDGTVEAGSCFAVCTGRLSSEIVVKAWRAGLPVLVSRSCATTRAVEIASDAGITLVGFARGPRFSVYCHGARIRGGG